MRFWDTSALVPLVVMQPATSVVRELLAGDPTLIVWWGTRIECVSALARLRREGTLEPRAERAARKALEALAGEWSEVLPTEAVRTRAEHLLAIHTLRAADAVQLAAAGVWARSQRRPFVSLDERLRDAATREGFVVMPE